MAPIELYSLTDGGQTAEQIADRLVPFLAAAKQSLDIALYDVRLPGAVGDRVANALRDAQARGVAVRICFNLDGERRSVFPPTPKTVPEILQAVGVPTKAIPGEPDLMHHKYVVRDAGSVWTGSTNWTLDSWQREENVIVTVDSRELAAEFAADFAELWEKGSVEKSGFGDPNPIEIEEVEVRAWFSPGHGEALAHRIARAIGQAQRRVRIASPVLTSGPILATLAEAIDAAHVDIAGVVDATQIRQVFRQWRANEQVTWKIATLEHVLAGGGFSGKQSTPYTHDSVHDFMHAKVTVVDDTVFVGSFNLSRSGERNAENVLEIADAAIAAQMADFVDAVRARYPKPLEPATARGSGDAP